MCLLMFLTVLERLPLYFLRSISHSMAAKNIGHISYMNSAINDYHWVGLKITESINKKTWNRNV